MTGVALTFIGRELLMLALLGAAGSGATVLFGARVRGFARVGLAPILGLCLATAWCTTLLEFFPAAKTAFALPLLALASLALAWRFAPRRRGAKADERRGTSKAGRGLVLVSFCFVLLAAAGPITYSFIVRDSVGPAGYTIGDVQGYVATIDGAQRQSLAQAQHINATTPPQAWTNIEQKYWSNYANGVQELDATPVAATLNSLIGAQGTDTQSPFLVAYLLAGALGAWACVLVLTRSTTASTSALAAGLAGGLFGGAFFLQLYFDGSEAAICGLGLVAPAALIGVETLKRPRAANLVLAALTSAGLMALYPLFVPAVAGGVATYAAVRAWRQRDHPPSHQVARRAVTLLGGFVVLSGALNAVAWWRGLRYFADILRGIFTSTGLPDYAFLDAGRLPTWLFQLRQFYSLAQPTTLLDRIGLTVVLPLVLAFVAASALRRRPEAWLLCAIGAWCLIFGAYERVAHQCSYCEERNLLPIAPVLAILVAVGLAGLLAARARALRGLGVAIAGVTLAAVTASGFASFVRFKNHSFFLGPNVRAALAHLPPGASVELEGFGEGPNPPIEQGLVYMLAEEKAWNRVSLPADFNEDGSLIYLGGGSLPLSGRQFRPNYRYVLTDLGGVETRRAALFRRGPVALERRARPLDVTIDYGLSLPLDREDPKGRVGLNPYYVEPIKAIVTGRLARHVSVDLTFYALGHHHISVLSASGPSAPDAIHQHGPRIQVCMAATGNASIRSARVLITPSSRIDLTAMWATDSSCRAPRPKR